MRVAFRLAVCLCVAPIALLLACSSSPDAPIDPGLDLEEGGTSFGGSTGQGGGAASAGTAGTALAAQYPAGPYGHQLGSTIQDYTFTQGLRKPKDVDYAADDTTMTPIALHDFYNPTGDKSRPRVLLLTESALWCSACMAQAEGAMTDYKDWHPKGAEYFELVFEDDNFLPAQPKDLTTWTNAYALEYPCAVDPLLQLGVFFDTSAAPFNMVIDLSNMKITYASVGVFDSTVADAEFPAVLGR